MKTCFYNLPAIHWFILITFYSPTMTRTKEINTKLCEPESEYIHIMIKTFQED